MDLFIKGLSGWDRVGWTPALRNRTDDFKSSWVLTTSQKNEEKKQTENHQVTTSDRRC